MLDSRDWTTSGTHITFKIKTTQITVAPIDDTPTTPPPKGYNGGGHSPTTTFNVLDFGAKGDGKSDDTKVNSFCTLLHSANGFDVNSANKFNMQD